MRYLILIGICFIYFLLPFVRGVKAHAAVHKTEWRKYKPAGTGYVISSYQVHEQEAENVPLTDYCQTISQVRHYSIDKFLLRYLSLLSRIPPALPAYNNADKVYPAASAALILLFPKHYFW